MATTDYDFNRNRKQIITRAFRIIGVLGAEDSLSAEQEEQGQELLNSMIKEWQTKSVFLWTIEKQSLSILANQSVYSLSNDVIYIERAWYNISDRKVPIEIISYREYEKILSLTTKGQPLVLAIDYKISSPNLYLYPIPSDNRTLEYLAVLRLKDMDTSTGTPSIPQRFLNALIYGLASYLADEYGLPLQERGYIKNRYSELFGFAMQSDREQVDYEFVDGAFGDFRRK